MRDKFPNMVTLINCFLTDHAFQIRRDSVSLGLKSPQFVDGANLILDAVNNDTLNCGLSC